MHGNQGGGGGKNTIFLAVVGRSQPRTGGEYYNAYALQGLSEAWGEPWVLAMAQTPSWIRGCNRPGIRPVYYVAANVWFLMQLARLRPEHCYIDFFMFRFLWLYRVCAWWLRIPDTLVVVHDLYHVLMPKGVSRTLVMRGERFFLNACGRIVTTSADTARRLEAELGVEAPSIDVLPPGIEMDEAIRHHVPAPPESTEAGPLRVLYVGMVKREKGVIDLVRALQRLREEGLDAELHIAGQTDIEPEYTAELKRIITASGLVTFHGFMAKPELHALYRQSHVFVLPSYYETFGIVVIEAMQFGLPVVAAASGGIPEIVTHGENGLLYRPGDVEELAACLRELAASPALRARLGAAGRQSVETRYGWDGLQSAFRRLAA